tara:strand:+ start:652 stop:1134 length:483 start_codon:yes stop_codon:yes gene_type:complete
MPSFDVVSEIDQHELVNAIDQTTRELANRFDFKGSNARVERGDDVIKLVAEAEFQTRQMLEILQSKMTSRGIDIDCIEIGSVSSNVAEATLPITVREGIDSDLARKLIKLIKETKLKAQAQFKQNQLRVTAKKRDVLQDIIKALQETELNYPLQFKNFRD